MHMGDAGKPIIGKKGELVCTAAAPSMPIRFWNDPDGQKYRSAYFESHPGVWSHGDYIEITERGGVIVYGRSDATLNPGASVFFVKQNLENTERFFRFDHCVEDDEDFTHTCCHGHLIRFAGLYEAFV